MRTLIIATVIATLAGAAAQAETTRPARAPSVERFATPASYTSPLQAQGHGYSWKERRVADCLADQAARIAPGARTSPAALARRCDI
jgi:hypothetical protein